MWKNYLQVIFLEIWQCEKARKPMLKRSLTVLNSLRNKQETVGNLAEFVLEACVSNARETAGDSPTPGFGGGWIT